MIRLVFMGTPKISYDVLKHLYGIKDVQIVGVVSQPDRLKNRSGKIIELDVKKFCIKNNILCLQPHKISDITDTINSLNPDLILTCAYGQFVPDKILNIPRYGSFNLHASLLPKLRGGAPVHWAIINGFLKTGVSLMKMTKKMDAGDVIAQEECSIDEDETTKSLFVKITNCATKLIDKYLLQLCEPNLKSFPQDENEVTFGLNITKQEEILDFNQSCFQVDCWIRGLYDKPIAIWQYRDLPIKVHFAKPTKERSYLKPGMISKISRDGIFVATTDYDIQIIKIQLPNKKPLEVSQIINGNHPFKVD